MKKAMDRASGSGVFARDPDAQLDMIELELTDEVKNFVRDGNATGWRLESSLREFPNIVPVNFWFEYPIHRVDSSGELKAAPAQGTPGAGQAKNSHCKSTEDAAEEFRNTRPSTQGSRSSVASMSSKKAVFTLPGRLLRMPETCGQKFFYAGYI